MDRRTRCAQGHWDATIPGEPLAPTIVPASTFAFDSQDDVDRYYETGEGYVYSRYENPTVVQVERLLAQLEGCEEAALFSSGMAAISTLFLALAAQGQRVACQREIYGGTRGLLRDALPAHGIDVLWLRLDELAGLDPARIEGCRLLFLETPVNPTLRILDLDTVVAAARQARVPVAVDATFATPILQRPAERGVDYVVHSASKYLGGHGDLIGGAVSGSRERLTAVKLKRRVLGGTLDPFAAFLLHRGMRTLAVRMDAHCRGAAAVASWLDGHPRVSQTLYPGLAHHPGHEVAARQMDGFGGMVALRVAGGAPAARRVHDRLRLFRRAGSLGGVESLVSIPSGMSHRNVDRAEREAGGVTDDLLRLSVGLESPQDLIDDLAQALES